METKLYAYPSDVRTTDRNVLKVLRESGIPINEAAWIASGSPGMELRDYFAGQALIGAMTGATNVQLASDSLLTEMGLQLYRVADAMIAARDKEPA